MGIISRFLFGNGNQNPNEKIKEMEKNNTYSGVTNQWYDKKTGKITSMKEFSKLSVEEIKDK